MKRLLFILVSAFFLFGCEDSSTEVLQSGQKVRVKGTEIEGRVYHGCASRYSWCEISYSHGKLSVPMHQLEKVEE